MTVAIGTQLAGYRIESVIARGGMGVVYRARELALDRPVALKLIAPELAGDPAFRQRFLHETRLAASIDHPGILPVYAAGETNGTLYLATRYVEGTDLRTVLGRTGSLPTNRALAIVGQVAEALDAAHWRGLVHRDVKPGNILLDSADHCYLCDFGLTKQLDDEGTTASELLAGSLDYLAPEQIRRNLVDGRSDQYALACVLCECLSGAPPFRRDTEAKTLWAHMQEEPAPLPAYPQLNAVLAKALAKTPTHRYPTCTDFVEAARAALGLGPSLVAVRRRRVRVGRRLIAVGAALLTATVAAVIIALILGGGGGVTVPPNSVAALDPESGEVVAAIPVGEAPPEVVSGAVPSGWVPLTGTPRMVAASDAWVWVIHENAGAGTISKIDADSRRVVNTFSVTGEPVDLIPAAGSLWISTRQGHVFRIDPSSDRVRGEWTLPNAGKSVGPASTFGGIGSLAYGDGAVWGASFRAISRIDPATSRLVSRKSAVWGPLATVFGSVWVHSTERAAFFRLAPETLKPEVRIHPFVNVPFERIAVAVGEGSVWRSDPFARMLQIDPHVIDPDVQRIAKTLERDRQVHSLAVGGGSVWAATGDDAVFRIDPATRDIKRIEIGETPVDIAVGAGLVWVIVQ